jgi:hypothetical protein
MAGYKRDKVMSHEINSERDQGSIHDLSDQNEGSSEEEESMSAQKMLVHAVDPEGKWVYRVGGICALVLGIAYLITIALYAYVGAPPSGGEAWLKYLFGKTTMWWAILGLSVLTDLLYVPVAFALYLALKGVARSVMLVASACVGLFIVLDLAVTWSNYASLITLSGNYAAATNDAQRVAYVAAANYASAVLSSRLEAVYAIVVLSFGILLIGLVMLKGIFSKSTAYVGVVTGVLGIVSIAGWNVTIIMNAVLATVWVLLVGYRLYRLGGRGCRVARSAQKSA